MFLIHAEEITLFCTILTNLMALRLDESALALVASTLFAKVECKTRIRNLF